MSRTFLGAREEALHRFGGHLVSDSRMRPTSVATGFDELDCSLPRCAAGREALPAMPFVFERREEGSGTGVTVTRSGSPRRKPGIAKARAAPRAATSFCIRRCRYGESGRGAVLPIYRGWSFSWKQTVHSHVSPSSLIHLRTRCKVT